MKQADLPPMQREAAQVVEAQVVQVIRPWTSKKNMVAMFDEIAGRMADRADFLAILSMWDVTDAAASTNIYKFDLQQVEAPLVAMGSVPGMTLNQFSLDETGSGLLRVATTDGFGDVPP
jgi:uncharacterized secreted protein with C-terminal beta-propeller domain